MKHIAFATVTLILVAVSCSKLEPGTVVSSLEANLSGIMTSLKSEFPNLKQKDYTLFGYLAIGFDAPIISHLMGTNPNSVYVSKYRLKKHIEESETSRKSEYLTILN